MLRSSFLGIHFAEVANGVIKGIGSRGIDALLALHGGLHHRVMGLESIDVVLVIGKDLLLDALAEAVLSHQLDDLGGVFLLGIDPADL